MRYGLYPGTPPLPFSPGYDVVGDVDAIGEGVSDFAIGDRIAALTQWGGYAQYIIVRPEQLTRVPAELDPAEAVSLVLNYVTAYQMLHRVAEVKSGQRILVHGGAGGVGTAALQLGRLAGLEMYATASRGKHANFSPFSISGELGSPDDFGLAKATPDVETANPVVGSGGSRHIQIGAKVIW